jgi:HEAT repeat protein
VGARFGIAIAGGIAAAIGLLLLGRDPTGIADPPPSAVAGAPAEAVPRSWRDTLAGWLGGTGGELEGLRELVDLARDPATDLELRIGAVRWIARDGSEEALEILEDLLEGDAPSALRAAIAESLGEAKGPEAHRLLGSLLEDEDEAVARGALRGLAVRADGPAVLEAVLLDADRPARLRAQAAAVLAEIGSDESSARLGDSSGAWR